MKEINIKIKDEMLSLLSELVNGFTKHHKELKITGTALNRSISFNIIGHADDHPKLVGTRGLHIWSLQTIFRHIGDKQQVPLRITLLEPEVGERKEKPPYVPNPKWKPDNLVRLITNVNELVFDKPVKIDVTNEGAATTFELFPTPDCDRDVALLAGEILTAFKYIFHAIGKAEGRTIYIDSVIGAEKNAGTC